MSSIGYTLAWEPEADPLAEGSPAATRLIRLQTRGSAQEPECFWGDGGGCA